MAYVPGLDLNTQISNEATNVAIGAAAAIGVATLATIGLIPKEFRTVKKPADIFSVIAGIAFNTVVDMVTAEQGTASTEPLNQNSASDVVDF